MVHQISQRVIVTKEMINNSM